MDCSRRETILVGNPLYQIVSLTKHSYISRGVPKSQEMLKDKGAKSLAVKPVTSGGKIYYYPTSNIKLSYFCEIRLEILRQARRK